MMRTIYLLPIAGALLVLSVARCQAQPGEVSLGVKAGTLGAGLEAGLDLNEYVVLRGGFNYLAFDFETTISRIDYTFEPTFMGGALLLDLHPFGQSFRFTAGLHLNSNEMDIAGTYRKDLIPANYSRYAALADLAKVKGTVEFDTFAPYAGIGWTSGRSWRSGWSIAFDVGIMFQGAPEVADLHVEDPWGLGRHPAVAGFIAEEKQAIQEELDNYEYYPIISLAASYRF